MYLPPNVVVSGCVHRYSMECLVSFIEIQQFQQFLIDHIKKDKNHTSDEDEMSQQINMMPVHPEIPQSIFLDNISNQTEVDDELILQTAKVIANKLYDKYIKIGSQLEINISSMLKKEIKSILQDPERLMELNVSLNDLLLLFEKPKNEMRLLLTYSHVRFKQKVEYSKIVQLFSGSIRHRLSSSFDLNLNYLISN